MLVYVTADPFEDIHNDGRLRVKPMSHAEERLQQLREDRRGAEVTSWSTSWATPNYLSNFGYQVAKCFIAHVFVLYLTHDWNSCVWVRANSY